MMISPKEFTILPVMLVVVFGFILIMIKKPKLFVPFILAGVAAVVAMNFAMRASHMPSAGHAIPSIVNHVPPIINNIPSITPPVNNTITAVTTAQPAKTSAAIPDIWKPGIENQFEVSEYSSVNSAAIALAKWVTDYLDDCLPDGSLPEIIQICGNNLEPEYGFNMQTLELAANELESFYQQQGKEVKTVLEPKAPDDAICWSNKKAVSLSFNISHESFHSSNYNGKKYSANLNMKLQNGYAEAESFGISHSVAYNQADWISDTISFINNADPQSTIIIGYSSTATSDPIVAKNEAVDDAVNRLAHAFNSTIRLTDSDRSRLDLIRDTYTQKLNGSQGDIYRAAVLLIGTTSVISSEYENLQNKYTTQVAQQQTHARKSALSEFAAVAILLGAILLSYFLLDFITKGYYKGRLLLVLVSLAVLGIIVIANLF